MSNKHVAKPRTLEALAITHLLLWMLWILLHYKHTSIDKWFYYNGFHLITGLIFGTLITAWVAHGMQIIGYNKRIVTGVVAIDLAKGLWHILRRSVYLCCYAIWFIYLLLQSNLQVVKEVLTRGYGMEPRMLRVPVGDLTPSELVTFASAITLTPGTLSTDVSEDSKTLYVHAMYANDEQAAIDELITLKQRTLSWIFGKGDLV